jgi:hypothetical protein
LLKRSQYGIYVGKGRPDSIDAVRIREMKAQGLGATAIAKVLGIGRASSRRVLEAAILHPKMLRLRYLVLNLQGDKSDLSPEASPAGSTVNANGACTAAAY